MERIILVGCGGAGKSTLARAMGERTGIPVVHLDQIFWRENWQSIPREEFDQLLQVELEKPRWIIDGDYGRTLPLRLKYCDTAIFLDYPRWQCVLGVLKRILTSHGRTRPDMAQGCKERFDWEFLTWVWNWRKNKRQGILDAFAQAEGVRIIILKSRREGRKFLKNLSIPSA